MRNNTMKRQQKQILSCVLALAFLFLGVCSGKMGGIHAYAKEQERVIEAFVLKKETPSVFPLFRGNVAFRLFDGIKKAARIGKTAASFTELAEDTVALGKKQETALPKELGLGGTTFGVRLLAEGVLVVGVNENEEIHPAYDAGIRATDRIIEMNGKPIRRVDDVGEVLDNCGGNVIDVTCLRNGKREFFKLTPHKEAENGKYKAGILIRDQVSGIGTMTYYDPKTGEFGGLGHGICDLDTGVLVPIVGGAVLDVSVTDIVKGEAGKPGELRGFLKHEKKGALIKNHECGVFGVLSTPPCQGQTAPVAGREEVKEGKAYLLSALDGDTPKEYEIKISRIHTDAKSSKCFAITVTDPALLSKTGGIIQGMSGSPIIQNGKLIGAVTHVMVADPTKGYGIFIDNMLAAAQSPKLSQA